MSSNSLKRARQQQILREAEGYLELLTVFEDRWPLPLSQRRPLAERALRLLQKAGYRHGQHARRWFLEGYALRVLEEYEQAIEPLEMAADLAPEDISIWLMLGWCYKRCGRVDQAIAALENALEYEPGEAILYYNLACYWSLAGSVGKTLHFLSRAFQIDPNYRDMVADEPDFDPVRDDPAFVAAMSRSACEH
ncbi:MAG TPA: tetratricopeptide repeat protein [Planctomycetaceae bacterium]|nr:tetratricopeptide repeat protein [Planctomycetaceae bacterium]